MKIWLFLVFHQGEPLATEAGEQNRNTGMLILPSEARGISSSPVIVAVANGAQNKCMSRSGLDNINEQQCLAQLGSVSVETETI